MRSFFLAHTFTTSLTIYHKLNNPLYKYLFNFCLLHVLWIPWEQRPRLVHPQLSPQPRTWPSLDDFLFFKIFFTWTILWVFTEFVTILLLLYVFIFWPQGIWNLISLTRNWTHAPYIGRRSLNHRTTKEVPRWLLRAGKMEKSELVNLGDFYVDIKCGGCERILTAKSFYSALLRY